MRSARERRAVGRRRLALAGGALARCLIVALIVVLRSSGGKPAPPPLPLPGIGQPAKPGDPFAYVPGRESEFVARAIAGSDHVLFAKSPGGALATAARVARVPAADRPAPSPAPASTRAWSRRSCSSRAPAGPT